MYIKLRAPAAQQDAAQQVSSNMALQHKAACGSKEASGRHANKAIRVPLWHVQLAAIKLQHARALASCCWLHNSQSCNLQHDHYIKRTMVVMQLHVLIAFGHHHSSDCLVEDRQPCQHLRLILKGVQASTVTVPAGRQQQQFNSMCASWTSPLGCGVICFSFC
jgi:hypothetical protein